MQEGIEQREDEAGKELLNLHPNGSGEMLLLSNAPTSQRPAAASRKRLVWLSFSRLGEVLLSSKRANYY